MYAKRASQAFTLVNNRKLSREEFARLDEEIQASQFAAKLAWDEYVKHVNEHGC